MEEELISFETAKLAKEKGFDITTKYSWYISDNTAPWMEKKKSDGLYYISAPTQSLLQKWLREKHKLYVAVTACTFDEEGKYSANLSGYSKNKFLPVLVDGFTVYEKYEEALEEGIEEALKLI